MRSCVCFMLLMSTTSIIKAQSPGDTACAAASPNDLVPNPDDCKQFYFCTATSDAEPDFPLNCGDEYKCFDTSECSDDTAACIAACAVNGPTCKTACVNPGDQIFDPSDCNKHYLCDGNNNAIEFRCFEDHPFFNGLECVAEETQCCTCRKRTCTTDPDPIPGELIVNERDCHSFYTCVGAVPYGPTSCPDGGVFDPDTAECDATTKECENSCNIGVVTTTKATSGISTSTSSSSTTKATHSTSTSLTTIPTTTSTPTTTPGCLDISDFTCPGHGFYPRCPWCNPSYFTCEGVGNKPTEGECSGDLVFNPTPGYGYCVLPENCPIP